MEDLLTTRQVLDYLKVDRITVYRMVNDGRLKGIKIGQHWRFARSEVERLVAGEAAQAEPETDEPLPSASFPTHCVQTIQDLFSEVSQISALIVDPGGEPLTEITQSCPFCQLVLGSPKGLKACHDSWRAIAKEELAGASLDSSRVFTCHAGLQYLSTPVVDEGQPIAMFLLGQFYWQAPRPGEDRGNLRQLAQGCNLPVSALQRAAGSVPVIHPEQQGRVSAWPKAAARAVQGILHERTGFMSRLQQIATLSQIS
jgi:excisionase family DNA binding protein